VARPTPFLVSRSFDLGWFIAPGLLAWLAALAVGLGSPTPRSAGPGLWIVGIVLVDVAHVWASLWRTYLDPQARRLHRRRLLAIPLACAWVGFLLHLESPRAFWAVLAYLAIFHFIRQHEGFVLLYLRRGGASARDRGLARATIGAGTLGPVLWWHANLPREFAWFVPDDLVAGLPGIVGTASLAIQVPLTIAFLLRRPHPVVAAMVLGPVLSWNTGIVWFDDDRIFTLTNVFGHGIPYLALVWATGGRERATAAGPGRRGALPIVLGTYYGLLVALAFAEETLWDRLVWHERAEWFGAGPELAGVGLAAAVALLTVPQATHYVLDRFIWRVGPDNPRLAGQLGLAPPP
jgi:hypothetical protein